MRINSKAKVQRATFDGSEVGEGLSIFFSQNGDSTARYRCLVQAETSQGIYDMGEFFISPPVVAAAPAGRLSRMVAGAVCPGAIGWAVEVSAVNPPNEGAIPAETAEIILASSKCCTAPIGVSRVGERYGYVAGASNVSYSVLAGQKVTGIAALATGAGTIVINGGNTIAVPSGMTVNIEPKSPIPPNGIITLANVDWVIEFLESA